MNGNQIEDEDELPEEPLDVLDRAVGAAARAGYDTAYVTALKSARALLKSTNAETALRALDEMISVFDPGDEVTAEVSADPGR